MNSRHSFGFATQKAANQNPATLFALVALQPLWHRRGTGLWWFAVSLVFAAGLYWIGEAQGGALSRLPGTMIHALVNLLFLAIALAIQTSWFRSVWQPGLQFSLWNSSINNIALFTLMNVSGWLFIFAMLIFPGSIAIIKELGRDLAIWWEAPLWGISLWLSASAFAHFDSVFRKLMPPGASGPATATLIMALLAVSSLFLPLGKLSWIAFLVPGGATLYPISSVFWVLGAAALQWIVSAIAFHAAMQINPLWIKQ